MARTLGDQPCSPCCQGMEVHPACNLLCKCTDLGRRVEGAQLVGPDRLLQLGCYHRLHASWRGLCCIW